MDHVDLGMVDHARAHDLADSLDDDHAADPGDDEVEVSRRARYVASVKDRVETQVHEHGVLTVYVTAALPTPATTIATTAAASAGMTYLKFVAASFAGFLTMSTVLVLIGQGVLAALRSFIGPGYFS